jgi:hypothetical protein
MFRLGTLTVILLGISVAIIVLSWSYFWHYAPDVEDAKYQTSLAQALHKNAATAQKGEQRKENAQKQVAAAFDAWRAIISNHTPPTSLAAGGINLDVNTYYLPVYAHQYRNSLQLAVNKQVKIGGVKVVNGPTIPDPGDSGPDIVANFFNYPAIPFPIVIFDLGQITVQGSYQQIKANVLGWANMPNYFAVADGLALNGTSPTLTGTYSVSMIGYLRGKKIYPGLPTQAAQESVADILATAKSNGKVIQSKTTTQTVKVKTTTITGPGAKAPGAIPSAKMTQRPPAGAASGVRPPAGVRTGTPGAGRPGSQTPGAKAPAAAGGASK